MLIRNTCCLQRGNVTSFRGYLRHPVVLPEEDRFAHAEYRVKYLYPFIELWFSEKRLPSWKTVFVKRDR